MTDAEARSKPPAFAEWLITMFRALGYTRDSEIARALGVEQSTVSRWRRGGRPSVEHLAKVSALTRTQLEPLLVLAGYVDPDAVCNAELPEPPSAVDPGERMISCSPVSEAIKAELRNYWRRRIDEEHRRLEHLIGRIAVLPVRGLGWPDVVDTRKLVDSGCAVDVADLLSAAAEYAEPSKRAEKVKELRAQGWSYNRISEYLDLNPGSISRILRTPAKESGYDASSPEPRP